MNNELMIIDEREMLGKDFKMYGTYEEPLFLEIHGTTSLP